VSSRDLARFEFRVGETSSLSAQARRVLFDLFEANYSRANPAFLERSLRTLRYVARAELDGAPAGFALGETRVMELPRLGTQVVSLAGICCVAPEHRRRGLFGELMRLAIAEAEVPEKPRRLVCGRMAHPAPMRTIGRLPTAVPKPGHRLSAWQREVGAVIAKAYGVHDFDPETFVCIGSGEPIGYPRIEFDVEPHEWEIFAPVDRDRGDALLSIAWSPDAPPGW
jgi:GNAT superfamily N-acetyltransferase